MSNRTLRIILLVLGVLGIALASYLTYVHYAGIKPACTAGESCTKVQTSQYSKLAGVPVALMGLIGYILIVGSLLAPENENSRLAAMSLTFVGFAFSGYLTYRELFSIHAVCEECATSAVILTVMMCLSVWRFLRGDEAVRAPAPGASGAKDAADPEATASVAAPS
jgi:uncharacterized membrane protein